MFWNYQLFKSISFQLWIISVFLEIISFKTTKYLEENILIHINLTWELVHFIVCC